MGSDVYRDPSEGLARHRAEVAARNLRDLRAHGGVYVRLHAWRCARAWAGGAAIGAMALLWGVALAGHGALVTGLALAGALVGAAWIAGALAGAWQGRRRLRAAMTSCDDEACDVHAAARALSARVERASLALPLAGASLLLPLAVHVAVVKTLGALYQTGMPEWTRLAWPTVEGLDMWVRTLLLMGAGALLALAALAWRFGRRLSALPSDQLEWRARSTLGDHLGACLAAAAGGALAGPAGAAIAFATAFVLVPWLYAWACRCLIEERAILGA